MADATAPAVPPAAIFLYSGTGLPGSIPIEFLIGP